MRPATRERVEAAILELGFVRDEAARHLRAGYSTTIGLMLLDAWNPGFMEIARGVEDRTAGEQWTVLMSNSARDTAREQRYLREYAERRVAGLLVIPNDQVREAGHRLPHDDIPMVVIDRPEEGPAGLSVAVDDKTGGVLQADHLHGLGHRRIAYVGNPEAALPVRARFAAFSGRLAEAGGTDARARPGTADDGGGRRGRAGAGGAAGGAAADRGGHRRGPAGHRRAAGAALRGGTGAARSSRSSATTTSPSPPSCRCRSPRCPARTTGWATRRPTSCCASSTGERRTSGTCCSRPRWW